MNSPLLNFLAAVGIGLVVGVIGAVALRRRRANAVWLALVLAVVGSLVASVIALLVGDDRQYGWKEPILQVVLAVAGVALAYFVRSDRGADAATASRP
jgi:uncharacterized membrane protein YeaQ/YmgE (transglycosylase-associated protein family)